MCMLLNRILGNFQIKMESKNQDEKVVEERQSTYHKPKYFWTVAGVLGGITITSILAVYVILPPTKLPGKLSP